MQTILVCKEISQRKRQVNAVDVIRPGKEPMRPRSVGRAIQAPPTPCRESFPAASPGHPRSAGLQPPGNRRSDRGSPLRPAPASSLGMEAMSLRGARGLRANSMLGRRRTLYGFDTMPPSLAAKSHRFPAADAGLDYPPGAPLLSPRRASGSPCAGSGRAERGSDRSARNRAALRSASGGARSSRP